MSYTSQVREFTSACHDELPSSPIEMTDEAIFNDTSNIIKEALEKTYNKNSAKTQISETAFEIALKQLI